LLTKCIAANDSFVIARLTEEGVHLAKDTLRECIKLIQIYKGTYVERVQAKIIPLIK